VIERSRDLSQLVILGIFTKGVSAQLLARQIEVLEGVAAGVDITFHRDDRSDYG